MVGKHRVAGWDRKDSTHAYKGYKSKFAYLCVQVINDIIPVLFCQMEPLPDELREPIPTAPAQGALGIPYLKAETS